MEIYQQVFKSRTQQHDLQVHVQRVKSNHEIPDPSCITCHPVITKPRGDFWNFWR